MSLNDFKFYDNYVDYATISIGLYTAATGIPLEKSLEMQNNYARDHSQYDKNIVMDDTYKSLPKRNVANTRIGYDLYNSGRILPSPHR